MVCKFLSRSCHPERNGQIREANRSVKRMIPTARRSRVPCPCLRVLLQRLACPERSRRGCPAAQVHRAASLARAPTTNLSAPDRWKANVTSRMKRIRPTARKTHTAHVEERRFGAAQKRLNASRTLAPAFAPTTTPRTKRFLPCCFARA